MAFGAAVLVCLLAFLEVQLRVMGDCPLDLSGSNFTLASSLCSNKEDRGKCCRYINAFVAVSVARYANVSSNLGVPSELSDICLHSISETLKLYGIPQNATVFCALGTKIPVTYECMGRTTVMQMLQSPKFEDVTENCKLPLSEGSRCRRCLNASILYLRHLIGAEDNITLSTCRDATFAALASQGDNVYTYEIASCFFGVQGLGILPVVVSQPSSPTLTPETFPGPSPSASPSQLLVGIPPKEHHHSYHFTVISGVGIAVTVVAVFLLVVLIFLIRKKSRELEDTENLEKTSWKSLPPRPIRKCQEGPSMFRKFSYKETKKATDNFNTIIGRGGFGTVYKAQFSDGCVVAVKRMNKVSEQGEDEFCREMELLGRLHHRHLVALRGFCVEKHERFLMYEYMENGSLKDHLHSPDKTPLSWSTRIQIAIDVANALEYLHFYCDPPLCHRDIKSSNILLDENFVAKVADFGLAHASKTGSISFEPVNTDIRGTPGYMDPEYVVTQELTEKSDIYSYGVLLLELVTARRAIQDSRNLVEWSQPFMATESGLPELVDPAIGDSFDLEQLQTLVTIVRWCTQREGKARPSIKQVLRLLYESLDPMHSGYVQAMEDESAEDRGRASKGKVHRSEVIFHSGDARCIPSSSSTSRSYCSRSFLLETGSPQSPPGIFSL
ncbi:PREDICTED: probable receptor-like protein kinase At1g49730 isoform X1 [Nelumbo nucifera]|uniref:Probable receptor-like protein kinase At1g49730 isoform X1 n=1 Tax=Nelumbo nucifera TaxID=4432 RepID=A0A1U8ADE1_NELNU|nr:PREDICTED: probable receptor-like protein kinase At1g49730 isoform X1 [Nelumbo nucifera]